MKLFVWEDVLCDFTSGIMFAIAPTVEEARAALRAADDRSQVRDDLCGEPQELDLSETVAFLCWGGG